MSIDSFKKHFDPACHACPPLAEAIRQLAESRMAEHSGLDILIALQLCSGHSTISCLAMNMACHELVEWRCFLDEVRTFFDENPEN